MVLFGKFKDTDVYYFGLHKESFDSFVELTDEEHKEWLDKASKAGKTFSADKEGKPVLVDFPEPPEPSEEEKRKRCIDELEKYLSSTDWYAIRFADTGTAIPEEIKQKRQEARDEISRLRDES